MIYLVSDTLGSVSPLRLSPFCFIRELEMNLTVGPHEVMDSGYNNPNDTGRPS